MIYPAKMCVMECDFVPLYASRHGWREKKVNTEDYIDSATCYVTERWRGGHADNMPGSRWRAKPGDSHNLSASDSWERLGPRVQP